MFPVISLDSNHCTKHRNGTDVSNFKCNLATVNGRSLTFIALFFLVTLAHAKLVLVTMIDARSKSKQRLDWGTAKNIRVICGCDTPNLRISRIKGKHLFQLSEWCGIIAASHVSAV